MGHALIYQARARTIQNDIPDALRLAARAFSAYPGEETAPARSVKSKSEEPPDLPLNVPREVAVYYEPLQEADTNSEAAASPTLPDKSAAFIPLSYVAEAPQRIEIYRKLAQATDKAALENLRTELRDRFGPVPPAVELLLLVGELKILASEKAVTVIEVKDDRLMLTRNNDFITLGGKFPRLTKKQASARLKEIKKLLLAL